MRRVWARQGTSVRRSTLCSLLVLVGVSASTLVSSATVLQRHHVRETRSLEYVAHFQIHVDTTSDWTTVQVWPGQFANSQLSGVTGSGTWHVQTSALVLNHAALTGVKTATLDVIDENLTSSPRIHIEAQKGQIGVTHVTIGSVADGKTTVVKSLTVSSHLSRTSTFKTTASVARSNLMDATTARLPRADPRRLVLAFYYPWYQTYQLPTLEDRPAQPRSPFKQGGVNSMTEQAKANGIDGFVQSWAGQHADGEQFRLALHAAAKYHQVITGYLESAMAGQDGTHAVDREIRWLVQLLHYGNRSSFLKSQRGVPVVFVYDMEMFTPTEWAYILQQVRQVHHLRVDLVGDDLAPEYAPFEWGLHRYSAVASIKSLLQYAVNVGLSTKLAAALHPHAAKKVFVATVSPGYDDHKRRGDANPVVPRDNGRRYAQSWRAAVAGQPDWIVITSWNEWFEGTAIEPGRKHGDRALLQTRHLSRAWKHS